MMSTIVFNQKPKLKIGCDYLIKQINSIIALGKMNCYVPWFISSLKDIKVL